MQIDRVDDLHKNTSPLCAWNTQEAIAEMMGLGENGDGGRKLVSRVIDGQIDKFVEMTKEFKPPIYNIWNLQKQDNATDSHFGSFLPLRA